MWVDSHKQSLEHVDDELEGQVAVISLGQRRGGGASSTTPPG